jgi:hypothetical protein
MDTTMASPPLSSAARLVRLIRHGIATADRLMPYMVRETFLGGFGRPSMKHARRPKRKSAVHQIVLRA